MTDRNQEKWNYEKVWIPITNISSDNLQAIHKQELFFMKNTDICFFTAELDITTNNSIDSQIIVNLPDLPDIFYPCENTILATKNNEMETIVRIKLENTKLVLYAYPFEKNTFYEFNIQLFMRVKRNNNTNK